MMKPQWDRFFENPDACQTDDPEMAELFQEIRDLESPDPGSDYWNQFNAQLQQGLAESVRPTRFRNFRSWTMRLAALSALLLVAGFVTFYRFNAGPVDQFQALEDLSAADLDLLETLLPYEGNDSLAENLDWTTNQTIDDIYDDGDNLYYDLESIDPGDLSNLLDKEG